jgi:hypothetical protein
MCQRGAILLVMALLAAPPAGAALTDVEPANDSVAGAPIQFSKSGTVTADAGELELVAGDIDFLGIADLVVGDIVTVTTTPLDDPPLQTPDTIVGLFASGTTDPTTMILCRGNDTPNNGLDSCPADECPGWGSLCRFTITAPGNYYVGVTGFRPSSPGGCTPGVDCTSYPFDGGIGTTPCEESSGETITCGTYQVTIGVTSLPEPSLLLQLASGLLGLTVLDKRRVKTGASPKRSCETRRGRESNRTR